MERNTVITDKMDSIGRFLDRARKKRSYVFNKFNKSRLSGAVPSDIREVLVIDSASRSGSSLLYRLLSRHKNIVSLNGEGSVFEKLHGIGLARSIGDSDSVPRDEKSDAPFSSIAQDTLIDSGLLQANGNPHSSFPDQNLLADSVQRLLLQHAEHDLDPDALYDICSKALEKNRSNGTFNINAYWEAVLDALQYQTVSVNPVHYDFHGRLQDGDPLGVKQPPPFSKQSLEEPPFVVPQPRRFPSGRQLKESTLLLKSSADAHRMWIVRRLFPKARFRFVVLARNPAGAVSGLMDGWLSSGFYSHNLEDIGPLNIKGYTTDELPWTRKWWKFDLPKGWADLTTMSLEDVCSQQWLRANQNIWRDKDNKLLGDPCVVRYESFFNSRSLNSEIGRILDFAQLERFPSIGPLEPVMSVTPPAPRKWRKRRELLAPIIAQSDVAEMAKTMGYETAKWDEWL